MARPRIRLFGREGAVHHVLLVLTILLVAVQPLGAAWAALYGRALYVLVLAGCMAAVYGRPRLFWVGMALGVPTLLILVFGPGGWVEIDPTDGFVTEAVGFGLGIATLGFVCVVLLMGVYARPAVTAPAVSSALTVYMLLGIVWGLAYALVELLAPGSFYGLSEAGFAVKQRELSYYSFVTLTTLGYGDIGPVSDGARSLVITEAVGGQLYIAVLVASLVGAFLNERSRARSGD